MDNDPVSRRRQRAFLSPFRRIETVTDAENVIRTAAALVLIYAGFKVLLGLSGDKALLVDAALLVLVAVPLLIFKNRFAAMVVLVLVCLVTLDVVMQAFAGRPSLAVLILVLLLWVSIRAVQAAFRLKRGNLMVDDMDALSTRTTDT